MKTMLHRTIIMALVVLCAVSCIYPFSVDTASETGTMVIEGDILIGQFTKVKASYSRTLAEYDKPSPQADSKIWVEDDKGGLYETIRREDDSHIIDTREADPQRLYRLCVENKDNLRTYVSDWLKVEPRAEIDSLSYIPDPDRGEMNVAISMHSNSSSHFKWSYEEDWEYHAVYFAPYEYIKPVINTESWNNGRGILKEYPVGTNTYYCWRHNDSSNIMTFSTDNQTDDRFVDLEFYKIGQNDLRISTMYRIKVYLEPLSSDAYQYWENIKNNTEYNGSLFAPNPSEMSGNLHCVSDTTEFVYGFINAAHITVDSLYIDQSKTNFYKYKAEEGLNTELVELTSIDWRDYYSNGWLPVTIPDPMTKPSISTWARARCVDCQMMGGTKKKPAGWPTKNQ